MNTRPPHATGEVEIQLKHHFDAAHRLPQLAGGNSKCASLHGHTWGVTLGITGPIQTDGTVVEFGSIKKAFRAFIDDHFDHGTLIGFSDPLLPVFEEYGMKHYVFGRDGLAEGIPWPSVEGVTAVLVRFANLLTLPPDCRVTGMYVTETVSNAVQWRNP
jgi:6-pyruvoyltetrahydropterin/6-carboxytetrahydropterin synthase